jgi:SAM-dependent methyltransferase
MTSPVSWLIKLIKRFVRLFGFDLVRVGRGGNDPLLPLREEFQSLKLGGLALQKLIDEFEFNTVLDIGCGAGDHAQLLQNSGKQVTGVDLGESEYFKKNRDRVSVILGDFNQLPFSQQYDCIWASHVLEHQPNVSIFLKKVHSVLKEGGVLAITVPPLNYLLVGGHLNLWHGGQLPYHLVLAGFDCREASLCRYDYNISVIVRKKTVELPLLAFDTGDIDRLAPYLPKGFGERYNGNIYRLNWGTASPS